MLRLLLLLLICWGIFISVAMVFTPELVLRYVKGSRMWMWYLSKVFHISHEVLNSSIAMRWVRVQGGIGIVVTFLALYAWFQGS